jgi:Ca2+-binding EF-hand superfamily protein
MKDGFGQAVGFGVFAGIMYASFGFVLPEPSASDMIDVDQFQTHESIATDTLIEDYSIRSMNK